MKRYEVGDRVCALVPGGGYAEFAVVHEDNALPVPPGLSFAEAAAIPETFFTVWTNVFDRGRLKAGETLLVHGGSSGIGTTAIMLAKALGRPRGRDGGVRREVQGLPRSRRRSGDQLPDPRISSPNWPGKAIQPDVILDMVGGDYVARNLKAAALHGRIVNIAFQKGSRVEVDLMPIMLKRLTLHGLHAPAAQRGGEGRDRPGA